MAWGDEDDGLGVGEDVVLNILGRLPARFFSFAACVCRSWRRLCNQILSRPKLLSALSLNPRPRVAIDEAFEKVLSKPIRPHFFIACIGNKFGLKRTHQLLKARVGTTIPLITCLAPGIIGSDACTNELKEVKWTSLDSHGSYYNSSSRANHGILLITGFVPGIKVGLIPLFKGHKEASRESTVDLFLNDIKNYTASVSDCNSPAAIVMFSDHKSSVRDVLERMDCSLSRETVIAGYLAGGDDKGCFLFSGGDGCKTTAGGSRELCVSSPSSTSTNQCNHTRGSIDQISLFGAVALVFVKDRDKSPGIGEIHFHLSLSTGLSPIGTTYKAASVRVTKPGTSECLTWLTARRDGSLLELGGQSILNDLENEVELLGCGKLSSDSPGSTYFNRAKFGTYIVEPLEAGVGDDNLIYIGVLKQRKQKFKKGKLISSYAFHEYSGNNQDVPNCTAFSLQDSRQKYA